MLVHLLPPVRCNFVLGLLQQLLVLSQQRACIVFVPQKL
jgi:hypothetical protein